MRFHIGQRVEKYTGDYTGPGIVLGVTFLGDGIVRYVVGHKIEGGTGVLLHLYSESNLREYPEPLPRRVLQEMEDSNGSTSK